MAYKVSDAAWTKYKTIIQRFLDEDAGLQTITWKRHINQILSHGEDYLDQYIDVTIHALCYYNAFRNWPINDPTSSGENDDENLSILIPKSELSTGGYLDASGYFNFNWSEDRFVINGITYKPAGDTQVAQAKDEGIVFLIILKRERN